jgi:hypothetical protein
VGLGSLKNDRRSRLKDTAFVFVVLRSEICLFNLQQTLFGMRGDVREKRHLNPFINAKIIDQN